MRPNQVSVGDKFFTRVTQGKYVQVEVVADQMNGTKRYTVARCDTGDILRKPRGAGELHLKPGPWARAGNAQRQADEPRKARPAPSLPTRRVATIAKPATNDLLKRLELMPPDAKQFLVDLIGSMIPAAVPEEHAGKE